MEAGARFALRVRVACTDGCDLRGESVRVLASSQEVASADLGGDEAGETDDIILTAPNSLGESEWSITYSGRDGGRIVHGESAATVRVAVRPHTTSVAVWGVPSPVVGSSFTVRAGIKCSSGCRLGGQLVEVRDETGRKLGEGRLLDEPRPGTSALYETELVLEAPPEAGVFSRLVGFAPADVELPHGQASGSFSFRTLERPEHTVTVQVVSRVMDASMAGIDVRLGPYRTETDGRGQARVGAVKGSHELRLWRIDVEPASKQLDVAGDIQVEIEVVPRRVVDEDTDRLWM